MCNGEKATDGAASRPMTSAEASGAGIAAEISPYQKLRRFQGEQLAAAAEAFRILTFRCDLNPDHAAMARQKIDEAEMWARKYL